MAYYEKAEVANGWALINYLVWKVIVQKENIIILVVGPTGRGKSYTAIRVMELIQKAVADYIIREKIPYEGKYQRQVNMNQITVSGREFLSEVNKPAPKYSTILFDEVGVAAGGAAARKWASDINNALVDVTQTFRNMQLFTIFTAPASSYIDSKMRDLVHVMLVMKRKYVERGYCEAKVYLCELTNNPYQQQILSKWRPRLKGTSGKLILDKLIIRKPNRRLCEQYEEKIFHRKKEVRLLSEKTLLETKELISKSELREENYNRIAKEIANLEEKLTVIDIMARYDLGKTSARKIQKKAELIQKDSHRGLDWELARYLHKNNKKLQREEIMERFAVDKKVANSIYAKVIDLRLASAKRRRAAALGGKELPEDEKDYEEPPDAPTWSEEATETAEPALE